MPPFKQVTIPIIFGIGIDYATSLFDLLLEQGFIKKTKLTYDFKFSYKPKGKKKKEINNMDIKFISHKKALDLNINNGFVVCGDIHLINATTYINSYNGVFSNRLLELYNELYKACLTARQLKLPFIINGDLITTGLFDYPVEKLLTDLLLEFQDVTIYINLGNHDLDGKKNHQLNHIKIIILFSYHSCLIKILMSISIHLKRINMPIQ